MHDRQQKILQYLYQHKTVSMEELCAQFCYSRSTIRRDVLLMEEMGIVGREHGQVHLLISSGKEKHHSLRNVEHTMAKEHIAQLAKDFFADGISMFIDSSTTALRLCPLLADYRNVTVVTNGLETAQLLTAVPGVDLFVAGGYWRSGSSSLIGEPAIDYVKQFKLDVCFFSCYGLDVTGLYEASMQQTYVKKAMVEQADCSVLLCDQSKFDQHYKFRLATFDTVDYILTDAEPCKDLSDAAEKAHCEFLW